MLDGLNEQQRTAVTAPLQNALVLAGAGSGKTLVLVSRIAYLIKTHNFPINSILAVTFTNKAAKEMKDRLGKMLSLDVHNLWVGTFHGLCHRILRVHHELANLHPSFQIIDTDEQTKIVKQLIKARKLDEDKWQVKVVLSYINAQKEEGLRAKDVKPLAYGPSKTYQALYADYEELTKKQSLIDFGELILRCCELLRDNQELSKHYQTQFKAVLVDEFQDTNSIQYYLIRLLTSKETTVMAVGDDDQSIYGWRGAKIENIQRFEDDFPNTAVIRLEQNYRSTSTILHAANKLIENNLGRMGKSLWTKGQLGSKIVVYTAFNEIEEANFVAEQIKKFTQEGESLDSIACLYRSNAQSRVLEEAFIRSQIAYKIYAGVRFYERAEIKDAIAYLRLSVNPNDDLAFARIVNVPPRGIGEKSIEEVESHAKALQISNWDALCMLLQDKDKFTARAYNALNAFHSLVTKLQNQVAKDDNLESVLVNLLQDSGLLEHYGKIKSGVGAAKVDNLQEWVNAAKEFQADAIKDETISWPNAFLAHVALEAGESQNKDDLPSVHMMTIHAAKGLEFPVVFMVGVEEGIFPSRPSLEDEKKLEEERRLCYVGITRAKKHLLISYAQIRRLYGREERHRPSRFLAELPDGAIEKRSGFANTSDFSGYSGFSSHNEKKSAQGTFSRSKPEANLPYGIGQKVTHPKFGEGVVLAYEGGGVQMNIQVRFKDLGTKWLAVAYAKLEKLPA